jgi:hypothetical protein
VLDRSKKAPVLQLMLLDMKKLFFPFTGALLLLLLELLS